MDLYNKDISETLLESMQILIDASISKINYDKTQLYTIVDDSKKDEGIYLVSNNEIEFEAIANDQKYKKEDQVYITIPEGDFRNEKVIIGKKNKNEETTIEYQSDSDKIIQVQKFNIDNNEVFVTPGEEQVVAWVPWKDRDIDNDFTRLLLSMGYNCNSEFNIVKGNFGLRFYFISAMEGLIGDFGKNEIVFDLTELNPSLPDTVYPTNPADCADSNEFLQYIYNFNHLQNDKGELLNANKQLIVSDPVVNFSTLDMIGNIYNRTLLNQQSTLRMIGEGKKNIVGCFVTMYADQDFEYQDSNGQIKEFTEENCDVKIVLNNCSITFGYAQEDYTEDAFILNCYDTMDYTPSDFQLEKNAKGLYGKWIHYDEQAKKYVCLVQKKIEDSNNNAYYRYVNSINQDDDPFFDSVEEEESYSIKWYEESIGEPGDQWSGHYWKLIRTTKMFSDSDSYKQEIGPITDINKYLQAQEKLYGNIVYSPYDRSKYSNPDKLNIFDPSSYVQNLFNFFLDGQNLLFYTSDKFINSTDIVYMPITGNESISVKAVILKKYSLSQDDESENEEEVYEWRKVANSNTITFLNEKFIQKTEYNELILNILDEQKEFFLYEENCQIENPKLSEKVRTLQIELPTGKEINNLKVTWKIPLTNSMIEKPIKQDHLNNNTAWDGLGYHNITGTIEKQDVLEYSFKYYPGFEALSDTDFLPNIYYTGNTLFIVYEYNKEEYDIDYLNQITKQSFRIKDYYNIGATNNNIGCEVSINNGAILGWATKSLLFGQKSSNGSEYSFSIYFTEDSNKFFDLSSEGENIVTIQPQLYSNNLELNDAEKRNLLNTVSYRVLPNRKHLAFEDDSIIANKRNEYDFTRKISYTNFESSYCEYIEASLKVKDIILTAYLAIPVRTSSGYTGLQAPVHFNYSSQGERVNYLKEPLRLYGQTTAIEGVEYSWSETSLDYWKNVENEDGLVLADSDIKEDYKKIDLTITKEEDPRGWYKINVGYSLPTPILTNKKFSSLSLLVGEQYTIGNTSLGLSKGSTYQSSDLYNRATITIQEISEDKTTIYFTSSNLQTSDATQNWYIVPSGNTELGPNIRHCNSFDSETKQPWQSYDSNDWYSFSYTPEGSTILYYSQNRNADSPSAIDLEKCTLLNNCYQIKGKTGLAGDYYLYEPFVLPDDLPNQNIDKDEYRMQNQYFTVALVKKEDQLYIKFKNIDAINFGSSGTSFTSLIANIIDKNKQSEITRIDNLIELSEEIKEEYKAQVDEIDFPKRFYLSTKKNTKGIFPFSYTNSTLVDDEYFPVTYQGTSPIDSYCSQEDQVDEYLYYIYIPGFILNRESFNITGDTIENVQWRVKNNTADIVSSTVESVTGLIGSPQIIKTENAEAYYLQPSPMYIEDNKYFCLEACVKNEETEDYWEVWLQPLIIRQNLYQNEILNQWNGKTVISEEGNYIMSQAIGAGSKNIYNQFSGVFMGKVGDSLDDTEAKHGLYGFHNGAQAFGFREDGTAFIGKSGSGRIEFNGDKGTITSKSYLTNETGTNPQPQRGAYLDLDEGYLGIKTIDQSYYNGTTPAQGIIITHRPQRNADGTLPTRKSLLNIGPEYQFIQSANYSADSNTGMKIDLNNGKITGYNANLQFKNGNNIVTISSEVGTNGYPINVNNKFRVNWEGKLRATDAFLTGDLSSGTVGGWTINSQGIFKQTKVTWEDAVDTNKVYSDEFIEDITGESTNCYTKIYAPNRGGEIGTNGLTPDKSIIFSSGYKYEGRKTSPDSLKDLLDCWTNYQKNKSIPTKPETLWWMKDSYYEEVMKTSKIGLIITTLTLGAVTLAATNNVQFVQIYNNGNFNFGGGVDALSFRADTDVTKNTRWPLYINNINSTCFFGVAFGNDITVNDAGTKYNFGIRFQSLGSENYVIINHHGIKFVKDNKVKYYDPWK